MRLSEAEQNIKRDLAEKTLQPSDALWENIQQELDQKQYKPKPAYLWWKVGSVAAVLFLAFLAYQGFQSRPDINSGLVLKSKDFKNHTLTIKAGSVDIRVADNIPAIKETKLVQDQTEGTIEIPGSEIAINANPEATVKETLDDEVDKLLAEANNQLRLKKEDQQLVAEVNKLIDDVMSETEDPQQQSILEDMRATVLLAEVESEIELEKPPLLKFEIWDAIVSNFNQVKDKFTLN